MSNNEKVVDFIFSTSWDDLPSVVKHQAKRALLDTQGAMIVGGMTPVAKLMADSARTLMPGNNCTIISNGLKVSPVGASIANGFAANALDIDDGHNLTRGHPGACILPPLLAVCEMQPEIDGKQFLNALILGYEVGIRAGMIRHATNPTFPSSGSWGAVAGVAAVGKIMELDAATLLEALGVAEYHAPIAPMVKALDSPSMVKDSVGWGSMVCMITLDLVQRGFTGVNPFFDEAPHDDWIHDLGKRWRCLELYFKRYACCRHGHAPIDGALQILQQNNLSPQDIAKIDITTYHYAARLGKRRPEDSEKAQYNLGFGVAAALLRGKMGPLEVMPPQIFEEDILAMLQKINIETSEEYNKHYPERRFSRIEIVTKDGHQFDSGKIESSWDADTTLPTDEELKEKFLDITSLVLSKQKCKDLLELIWHLEEENSAKKIIDLSLA